MIHSNGKPAHSAKLMRYVLSGLRVSLLSK